MQLELKNSEHKPQLQACSTVFSPFHPDWMSVGQAGGRNCAD